MSGDQFGALLPLLLLVAVFWFLVLRPARNRQRQMATLQAELAVGAEVMLTSGVYATVTWMGEETVRVEIAPGTEVRVHRQAVGRVLTDEDRSRLANEATDLSDSASEADDTTSPDSKGD